MEPIARLYVDSNIFIYTFESEDARAELLRRVFSRQRNGPLFATSELSLAETLVGAYRKSDQDLIEIYRYWIAPNTFVDVQPVERTVLWNAAILRATHESLKLADAIHLATAFHLDCTHFLTGDRRLRREYVFIDPDGESDTELKRLKVLMPEKEVLEHLIDQS